MPMPHDRRIDHGRNAQALAPASRSISLSLSHSHSFSLCLSVCRFPWRFFCLILILSLIGAGAPRPLQAQEPPALPDLLPPPAAGTLELVVLGGWGSFSQQPLNEMIQFDNALLTAPTSQGGAGLDRGLDQLTDGFTWGAEARWRFAPRWSAVAGFHRLAARTDIHFAYDPGSGPIDAFLEYETSGYPVWAGILYTTRLSERLSYGIGMSAVLVPASTLHLAGYLGTTTLDQEGTASGLGAMLTWEGGVQVSEPISLITAIRLRLARIGDPEDDTGSVITNPQSGDPLTLDWSGVDIMVGLRFTLF